jgi:signal peptidase I
MAVVTNAIRWTRRGTAAVALVVVVLGMGSLLAVNLAGKFGDLTFGMKTGSMHPAINPGDLVVDRAVPVSSVHVGDIITARRPTDHAPYSHRVQAIIHTASGIEFRTKGDANPTIDPWVVSYPDGTAYRVVHVVHDGGYALNFFEDRSGRDLIAASVFAVVLMLIWPVIAGTSPTAAAVETAGVAGAA